eukprot:Nitzschia sp. Nitz4//scaffold39_size137210//103503//107005//NITZ4_003215-RA/size137210-augustus-gene-0.185-mRNA-1//1//CDS//3329550431//8140//frame0
MSKLHPIYVALDSYQYSKAIKLASALPDSNTLGKALLAHAYFKGGQKYNALLTIHKLLGSSFVELDHEVQNSLEAILEQQSASKESTLTPEPAPTAAKKGKKGKKKPSVPKPAATQPTKQEAQTDVDILDKLQTQPTLPQGWDTLPPPEGAITDETTLQTIQVTLQNLKLPLTSYQLFAWAASARRSEEILIKTFCLGLAVLASPSKWSKDSHTAMEANILAHIQSIALTWARLYAQQSSAETPFPMLLATAWASQTALWQLQWLPADDKRSMILPRLAESMAQRLMASNGSTNSHSQSAEVRLLVLRTLEQQEKWADMLQVLDELDPALEGGLTGAPQPMDEAPSDFGVALTGYQVQTEKARVLCMLKKYGEAQKVYEKLLESHPDDWSCWQGHATCCAEQQNGDETLALVDSVLSKVSNQPYPLRGPHLMKVGMAARKVRDDGKLNSDLVQSLEQAIETYSDVFGRRAACAFSDLEEYVALLTEFDSKPTGGPVEKLLRYVDNMEKANIPSEGSDGSIALKERQARLRGYIFSIKMKHKLVGVYGMEQEEAKWFPSWTKMVEEWKETLPMDIVPEGGVSQREVKPGDDLMMCIVQQIMYQSRSTDVPLVAATLLETAIQYSPDNAYLKMAAIIVYHKLDAMSRAWELYKDMSIKHIQLDSCSFTILPFLFDGGLYNEAIEVCNSLLRFQSSTTRDCGDYAGRAMEGATLSKANEFLVFQRRKMIRSLALLEAKGLILDAAPLLATASQKSKNFEDPVQEGSLGLKQGIVGGEHDTNRATQMIAEAYNPYGALSLVSWASHGGSMEDSSDMADNRDFSVYYHQVLYKYRPPTKYQVCIDALRRGHIHGLLIRATLCMEASKGPKKGKTVKPSTELVKRTTSLLDFADKVDKLVTEHALVGGDDKLGAKALMSAVTSLCRVLAVVNAGMPSSEADSLEDRERRACQLLEEHALSALKEAHTKSLLSVKDTCSMLANYMVPLFALFKMTANICDVYGWGKRKYLTKPCATNLAKVAAELKQIVDSMLRNIESLPASEDAIKTVDDFGAERESIAVLDDGHLQATLERITKAQYRSRVRVEPILQEMAELLGSFDLASEG